MEINYTCTTCDSTWTRLRRRGSSQLGCLNGCSSASLREVWTCEACGADWTRVPVRGQRPKSGPCCRTSSGARKIEQRCWVCSTPVIKVQREAGRKTTCSTWCHTVTIIGLGHYPSRSSFELATRRRPLMTIETGQCEECELWFVRRRTALDPSVCSVQCLRVRGLREARAVLETKLSPFDLGWIVGALSSSGGIYFQKSASQPAGSVVIEMQTTNREHAESFARSIGGRVSRPIAATPTHCIEWRQPIYRVRASGHRTAALLDLAEPHFAPTLRRRVQRVLSEARFRVE
ncbi:hypothetical protein [Pseudoclavibacter sp. RFBA6]|uniref:hypothetical protein n=1 Tax=Pseudoclavibacter sp. RFBA6 TaxID=2080573 RepID=UPI0011AFF88F|nr:hypothetical protein [Pseudoclavibacter sp. RFBA6]